MKPEIRIVADAEALYHAAAQEFAGQAKEAVRAKGLCTVALSGGATPKGLYALLATDATLRREIPWDKIHVFWGDERHVPPDHPDSNYRMAQEALLSKVPLPAANVHRIQGEDPDASRAAEDYEQALRGFFQLPAGRLPRFDLVFLGLGAEGHTASLFPGTQALQEQRRLVVSSWVGKLDTDRITLTAPVLNNAAQVIFLVSGGEKAIPLKAVLEGNYEPLQLPAQAIRPADGKLLWMVDQSAGRLLPGGKDESPDRMNADSIVFLFDVDNTLLDNDRVTADLKHHLENKVGHEREERYWAIFEQLRAELGYADYLGALQRYRVEYPRDPHLLTVSHFLVDYPFANRLFPNALDVLEHTQRWGRAVIMTDGDVVFQPRKIERSGLFEAVEGNVLIYIHKEQELADVERRHPAERYVLVDDKLRILTAVKEAWGPKVITVFPRQGHYARDPQVLARFPPADVTIERIGDLLSYDLQALVAAEQPQSC